MAGAPARRVTLPVFLVEDGLVTDGQVRRLREKRMSGKTLAAAAVAGMSERTARKWQRGALPSTVVDSTLRVYTHLAAALVGAPPVFLDTD